VTINGAATGAVPVVRHAGEGERFWFAGGGIWTMKASAAETGGAFTLFEDSMVRGKATPLHLHPNEDETFYVLEGELRVYIDGDEHAIGAQATAVFPRGVPHAFLVVSETARVLCVQTPGTGEGFYREVSEPATDSDASRPSDFSRLREAAERHASIELLGPPPFQMPATGPAV
jgi:quercetin dioxygenase-like cupin family protein